MGEWAVIETAVLHTCEDGHCWQVQADGGASPSWGYGLTSVTWDGYDPHTCPEPERDREGRVKCAGCGELYYTGHGMAGVMCDPWNYDERCQPAPPACRKPAVTTAVWVDGNRRKGIEGGWKDVDREPEPGEQMALAV